MICVISKNLHPMLTTAVTIKNEMNLDNFLAEESSFKSLINRINNANILSSEVAKIMNEMVDISIINNEGSRSFLDKCVVHGNNNLVVITSSENIPVKRIDFHKIIHKDLTNTITNSTNTYIARYPKLTKYLNLVKHYGWEKAQKNKPSFYDGLMCYRKDITEYVESEITKFIEGKIKNYLLSLENNEQFEINWKFRNS